MVGLCGHGYTEGGLSLVPLKMTSSTSATEPVCKQTLGQPNDRPNKVVLLLGDNLASKAYFKDAFVNYIFNVQVKENYRLILVDNHKFEDALSTIYAYIFNQSSDTAVPYNVVLVDVPPLGLVASTEEDVRVLQHLEEFLQEEFGTTCVNCVSLVAPSTPGEMHPLSNTYDLLSLSFDKVESITQVLVTDSTCQMSLLNALKMANIDYSSLFIFDTGDATLTDDSAEEYFLSQIFPHFDYHGVEDFFQELKDIQAVNMSLAKQLAGGSVDVNDISRLRLIHQCTEVIGHHDDLDFRQLMMKVEHRDESTRIEKLTLGDQNDKPTKVILLLGNKGSGKTTLATAMINHIFSVKFHDHFRLFVNGDPLNRLTNAEKLKKTRMTTAYTFNLLPRPYDRYNIVIIDTPGLGSSEEHAHNKNVISRSATLLRQICGVRQFDIIGYVTPAQTERLPDSYKSVPKYISSLLADEGGEKVMVLATQSDARRPPAVQALSNLGMQFAKDFKFNSYTLLTSVLSRSSGKDTHEVISELYWKIEHYSLSCFLAELNM